MRKAGSGAAASPGNAASCLLSLHPSAQREWQVRIGWLRKSEQVLQKDLPWRRFERFGPAHDHVDVSCCIVDGHGEFVRATASDAPNHEIANLAAQVLDQCDLDHIVKVCADRDRECATRPGRGFACDARAPMDAAERFEIAAAAPAAIAVAGVIGTGEGVGVHVLIHDAFV